MKASIEWFTRNSVAANLLMTGIFLVGLLHLWPTMRIPVEVTPNYTTDRISIRMLYRGATPAEVEESVTIRIEEAIKDLDGIQRITSSSNEGIASVTVEVASGFDSREILEDVKNRVDSIISFPGDTERPNINLAENWTWAPNIVSLYLTGEISERELKQLARTIEDELTALPDVSQVQLSSVRNYEIGIEVSEDALRRYGITFNQVASAVRNTSIDQGAGTVQTPGGDVLLRTKGRAYVQEDFEQIRVMNRPDGTYLTVADVATVIDGFEEPELLVRYNGKPATVIEVFQVGDQNALHIAEAVLGYVDKANTTLPPGVELVVAGNFADVIESRLSTLINSAIFGFGLVLIVLMLFLRPTIAFWVCLGIPVSFMGAIATMNYTGVTINATTLFAFILVLGVVVDDAIVTGENVYRRMREGEEPLLAAINGTKEVAVPVTFGVATTVVAFLAMALSSDSERAQEALAVPLVVVPVLIFSLIESKFVLPAHLKHIHSATRPPARWNPISRVQHVVASGLEWLVKWVYEPSLAVSLKHRYITTLIFIATASVFGSAIYFGFINFQAFPRIEGPTINASLTMPLGTPYEITKEHALRLERIAYQIAESPQYNDPETGASLVESISTNIGGRRGSSVASITMQLVEQDDRIGDYARWAGMSNQQIVGKWRTDAGSIPGAEELTFRADIGWGGSPIVLNLQGQSFEKLDEVAELLKAELASIEGVFDISDSFQNAKDEYKLSIKPKAELLGLTQADLGNQVRQAFYGQEAQRIPRDRDDIRVMVRYPLKERRSLASLENMYIRTPVGGEVPFSEVAEVEIGKGLTSIRRIDRARTVSVTADYDKESGVEIGPIETAVLKFFNEKIQTNPKYSGIYLEPDGELRQTEEGLADMAGAGIITILAIYALLAIPFRSYFQPLIVMAVIPFGLMGAVLGHMIEGVPVTFLSIQGFVALAGVVVNDSLVMVDYVNQHVRDGEPLGQAVRNAGGKRFRPIILTSLTTFAGLYPLIMEQSIQAQFLIPMAIALGYGVLFATVVTLYLVPSTYLILEDARAFLNWFFFRKKSPTAQLHKPLEHMVNDEAAQNPA